MYNVYIILKLTTHDFNDLGFYLEIRHLVSEKIRA